MPRLPSQHPNPSASASPSFYPSHPPSHPAAAAASPPRCRVGFYGSLEGGKWAPGEEVIAEAYDVPIPGYATKTCSNMRLWDALATQEFDLEAFNAGDYSQVGAGVAGGGVGSCCWLLCLCFTLLVFWEFACRGAADHPDGCSSQKLPLAPPPPLFLHLPYCSACLPFLPASPACLPACPPTPTCRLC